MLIDCDTETRHKLAMKGNDWKSVATSLGWGDYGGQFAVVNDNNSVWEDIEYEKEYDGVYETLWKDNEAFNQEYGRKGKNDKEFEEREALLTYNAHNPSEKYKYLLLRRWQKTWRSAGKMFFKKSRKSEDIVEAFSTFSRREIQKGLSLSNKLRDLRKEYKKAVEKTLIWKSPATFFTSPEKAFWRTRIVYLMNDSEMDDWIDLPGPASWWPESIKEIDDTGFFIPEDDRKQYIDARRLVYCKKIDQELWDLWQLVLPANANLQVLSDTQANKKLIESFYD
ncbi:hypothetical protein BOTCAL_2179g00010 [Botryotinia calthae]|uniref:Uncharacterized protein n=1 Tax=Botryotinia calthae TaxID=38488 RepID=A0A4Y8C951_9HELO|nr:hypothetical protein BOTCAL_2179g00010 [Botryotinia calthae]